MLNVMTEDQAQSKWCPFARMLDRTGSAGYNRGPDPALWTKCVASQCMAWRWRTLPEVPGDGYCGLATGPAQSHD
jgi:hypothetical protein